MSGVCEDVRWLCGCVWTWRGCVPCGIVLVSSLGYRLAGGERALTQVRVEQRPSARVGFAARTYVPMTFANYLDRYLAGV